MKFYDTGSFEPQLRKVKPAAEIRAAIARTAAYITAELEKSFNRADANAADSDTEHDKAVSLGMVLVLMRQGRYFYAARHLDSKKIAAAIPYEIKERLRFLQSLLSDLIEAEFQAGVLNE